MSEWADAPLTETFMWWRVLCCLYFHTMASATCLGASHFVSQGGRLLADPLGAGWSLGIECWISNFEYRISNIGLGHRPSNIENVSQLHDSQYTSDLPIRPLYQDTHPLFYSFAQSLPPFLIPSLAEMHRVKSQVVERGKIHGIRNDTIRLHSATSS